MEKIKIGKGYYQSGYGKGLNRKATVYLINGKLYARDKRGHHYDFKPLDGELTGYVRVNALYSNSDKTFFQVSGHGGDHHEFKKSETVSA